MCSSGSPTVGRSERALQPSQAVGLAVLAALTVREKDTLQKWLVCSISGVTPGTHRTLRGASQVTQGQAIPLLALLGWGASRKGSLISTAKPLCLLPARGRAVLAKTERIPVGSGEWRPLSLYTPL